MMADALQTNEPPAPPYRAIELANDPAKIAGELKQLTPQQRVEVDHGLANAKRFRELYKNGKATVETTGKLMLWSFLSRRMSPYIQESMFLDTVKHIGPWISLAAQGKFDDAALKQYHQWSRKVAPAGSGQPGAQTNDNLNAFGTYFLKRMSEKLPDGKTKLQTLHDAFASDKTGPEVRRLFALIGEGSGIDNKVVSFSMLVSGRDDVMILDRVQVRNMWDDGRFKNRNIYDGQILGPDGKPIEKTKGFADWTAGPGGILLHESIERGMKQALPQAYAMDGRPEQSSLGRYHWESWVMKGQQEASHGTIGGILREAEGRKNPYGGLMAKEGRYYEVSYGSRYGRDSKDRPYVLYSDSAGNDYSMAPKDSKDFYHAIVDPANGIMPESLSYKERKEDYGDKPWWEHPAVNRDKLDELVRKFGKPVKTRGSKK